MCGCTSSVRAPGADTTIPQYFSWRSTFYFLTAFAGLTFVAFIFFPDSWRRERSYLYQTAVKRAIKRVMVQKEHDEKKRARKLRKGLTSTDVTPATTVPPTPRTGAQTPARSIVASRNESISAPLDPAHYLGDATEAVYLTEKASTNGPRGVFRLFGKRKAQVTATGEEHVAVKLSITDVNPLPPMWSVLKQPNNLLAVLCSGMFDSTGRSLATDRGDLQVCCSQHSTRSHSLAR